MVQDTLRVPRGNPNGGEFAAKTQTMTEVSLGRADTTLLSIGIGELPKPITPFAQERNSRMNFKASATVAAALASTLMFGLTACSSDSGSSALDTSGATPTVTSAPAVTDGPTVATGTTVDADQAQALNKARGSSRAVQVADGTWVVTNVNEPLPTPVQQVLNAKAADALAANSTGGVINDGSGVDEAIFVKVPAAAQSATGKNFVIIVGNVGCGNAPCDSPSLHYSVYTGLSASKSYDNSDSAVAAAQAFIASQANPDQWAIITSF